MSVSLQIMQTCILCYSQQQSCLFLMSTPTILENLVKSTAHHACGDDLVCVKIPNESLPIHYYLQLREICLCRYTDHLSVMLEHLHLSVIRLKKKKRNCFKKHSDTDILSVLG